MFEVTVYIGSEDDYRESYRPGVVVGIYPDDEVAKAGNEAAQATAAQTGLPVASGGYPDGAESAVWWEATRVS